MMCAVLVLALVATGCNPGRDRFEDALGALAEFRDHLCACKDAACADKIQTQKRDYMTAMNKELDKATQASADQERRGRALEDEMRTCRKKLEGPARGSAGP